MTKLNQFLTITEAADFLGVVPNTLRNWEASGKICFPFYRHPINNYRLYKKEDLQKFVEENFNNG